MALPAGFLEELRARTPMVPLVSRKLRLSRSGKSHKGCCPFHGEKTPSFYVYDDGFHCFGCGAHGDAISFVMDSQGLSFIDAVTQLAGEAGLEVPAQSPQAARQEVERKGVSAALQVAQEFFRAQLGTAAGKDGLDYLRNRGLTDATIEKFGLGWSGAGRGDLGREMARQDVDADTFFRTGLLRETEQGERRELFYNRVMFPIRDRRGRIISFGGRILGSGQPKYVNGPETELFSKRRNLYGLDLAKEAVRGGAALLVVEGYMDVIALHQAGFTGAVAPLGTALTEEQLEELWLISPAPVLAFDGDKAGSRAALRALDMAWPKLTADRTLRLILLPNEHDPDSLIRAKGTAGFQAQLDAAMGATGALFDLLRVNIGMNTPEARARLRARLEAEAKRIEDRALSSEYRRDLLDKFFKSQPNPRNGGKPPPLRLVRPALSADAARLEQGRILTAILLRHPDLWHDIDEAFHTVELPGWLMGLRDQIFHALERHDRLDSEGLITQLHASGMSEQLARVFAADPLGLPACARAGVMPAEAEQGWWYHYGLLHGRAQLGVEIAQLAARDLDKETQARLIALCRAQLALDSDPSIEDTV